MLSFFLIPKPAEAAALHNMNGWAWSGSTGWISVNCEDPKPGFPSGDCAPGNGNYGLDIDAQANLKGWAWSTKAGWICFGVTCDGVAGVPVAGTPSNDHYCTPGHVPCARWHNNDSNFHGWAYILSETDASGDRGWISLDCSDFDANTASPRICAGTDFNVEFDEVSGDIYGFGWNGNGDLTGTGWIQFACGFPRPCGGLDWGVTTGWVNTNWDTLDDQEGIYSPPPIPGTGAHLTTVPMVFRNFSAPKDSTLACYFRASDNSVITKSWELTQRYAKVPAFALSYDLQATDPAVDPSGNPVNWEFSGALGVGCEIIGVPAIQKTVPNLIAVHPASWSFTGPAGSLQSDSNRAKYCLDGNLGIGNPERAFFENLSRAGIDVQCDTEGDLAYALLKARGIPVELRCRDNIDDDANFQKDCDGGIPVSDPDRKCRGIAYICIAHPAAPSIDPPLP
jgi:hypothetical protein